MGAKEVIEDLESVKLSESITEKRYKESLALIAGKRAVLYDKLVKVCALRKPYIPALAKNTALHIFQCHHSAHGIVAVTCRIDICPFTK